MFPFLNPLLQTTKNSLSELEKRERRAMERKLSEMEEELKVNYRIHLITICILEIIYRKTNTKQTHTISAPTTKAQSPTPIFFL